MNRLRAFLFLLPTLLLCVTGSPARAFEIHRHAAMTRDVLQSVGISGAALARR
jgi:hypothetical protein